MIAGVAAQTTTVVAPGADTVSIAQVAAVDAFAATLQTALANGQSYATQFITNLSAASDTYSFSEATNAANAAADPSVGSGGIIDSIAGALGGPSGSLNGNPFSLSSNSANIGNIGAGNWASAMSDCSVWPVVVCSRRVVTPSVTPPVPQHSPARRRLSAAWLAWAASA